MKRLVLAVLAVLVLASGGGWWWYKAGSLPYVGAFPIKIADATSPVSAPAASAPAASTAGANRRAGRRTGDDSIPRVVIGTAVQRDVPVNASGLGVVTASRSAVVRPQVDGRLIEVLFKEGQTVAKDEALARIDSRSFDATYRKALADMAVDEAQLALARQTLERQRALGARDIASRETIETAAAKVAQYEAAVASARATADKAKLDLDNTTVRAPWSGITGMRVVDEGNMVRSADTAGLLVLNQIDPITVVFTLPADALTPMARGASGQGRLVELLARDRKSVIATGKLLAIDNLIDQNTNAIKFKAVFDNTDRTLWPGQFVTARIAVDLLPGVVAVPATAVQRNADGSFAFVLKRDGKGPPTVEQRVIEVGLVQEDIAVIQSGLKAGERVVLEGQHRLKDGATVQPVEAAKSDEDSLAAGTSRP